MEHPKTPTRQRITVSFPKSPAPNRVVYYNLTPQNDVALFRYANLFNWITAAHRNPLYPGEVAGRFAYTFAEEDNGVFATYFTSFDNYLTILVRFDVCDSPEGNFTPHEIKEVLAFFDVHEDPMSMPSGHRFGQFSDTSSTAGRDSMVDGDVPRDGSNNNATTITTAVSEVDFLVHWDHDFTELLDPFWGYDDRTMTRRSDDMSHEESGDWPRWEVVKRLGITEDPIMPVTNNVTHDPEFEEFRNSVQNREAGRETVEWYDNHGWLSFEPEYIQELHHDVDQYLPADRPLDHIVDCGHKRKAEHMTDHESGGDDVSSPAKRQAKA